MTSGISIRSPCICSSAQLEARALGRAGRVVRDGLVDRRRRAEDPGSAHGAGILLAWAWTWSRTSRRAGASGELWLEGGRLVYHELPRVRGSSRRGGAGRRIRSPSGCRRTSAASASASTTSSSSSTGCTPFQRAVAERCGAFPAGESVTYGELAALAGRTRTRSAPPGPSAPGTASRSSSRATASSPPTARLATARSASSTSGGCSRSEGRRARERSRSDVRARARGDRPAQGRAAGWPSSRRSSAGARQRPPARRRADRAAPRASASAAGRAAGVRAPARLRRRRARSGRSAARVRAGRRASSSTWGTTPRALQALNEAGVLDARLAPLERPPRRVVGRSCCRAAYLRGAFLAAGSVSGPRNAHLELRTADAERAAFLAELAAAEGFALAVHERGGHAFAYAKGTETIAELLAFLGAHEAALRLGEERRRRRDARAREPARERRPRQPRAREPRRRVAAPRHPAPASARAASTSSRRSCGRSRGCGSATRRSPSASLPPLRAAGDEGRCPAPARAAPAPGQASEHGSNEALCRRAACSPETRPRRARSLRLRALPRPCLGTTIAPRREASFRPCQRAGRRGSSEDDLPLRFARAPDLGVGRGLNPTPDEHGPALRASVISCQGGCKIQRPGFSTDAGPGRG